MAIKVGGDVNVPDDSHYLSDESEFYGDEDVKQDLEDQVSSFNVLEWWNDPPMSLSKIAEANMNDTVKEETATLSNPYEGAFYGRQLTETVPEFLQRLPPQTTTLSELVPWIFIANPYRNAPKATDGQEQVKGEGPPEEKSDWAQFVVSGNRLLEELTEIRHAIEKKQPGKAKATITKAVTPQKDIIVQKLLDTATKLHCTSGKWMMFCDPLEINMVWSVVARATANNELGIAAKVAPDDGDDRKPRLICVYTKDFNDMDDVARVIKKMRDLKLVEPRKAIYYKCDAYTHLGLNSTNPYLIKASLYSSIDVLEAKAKKKDQKLEGFFYKKKDNSDWRQLE